MPQAVPIEWNGFDGRNNMRLLQLELHGAMSPPLDLHPMMTVVGGLDDADRQRFIEVVRALPLGGNPEKGRLPALRGLLEAHGVMLDLSPETLALLDMRTDIDPLVVQADLTGVVGDPDALARIEAERFIAGAPKGTYPDLDAGRDRQRSANETLTILCATADKSRADYAAAVVRAEAAAAALAEVDGGQSVVSEFDGMSVNRASSRSGTETDLEIQRTDLESQLSRIDKSLSELSDLDIRPIEVLVDAIRNPEEGEEVPSQRAAELADEFVSLQSQVAALEQQLEAEGRGTAGVLERLEHARSELADAERSIRKPSLSPADVDELETAHRAVIDAESAMSGWRRRGGQKQFDEARAAEQVVLDRVGFTTWSSYVMGAGLWAIDPVAEHHLERARSGVEEAEMQWAQIAEIIESDPEYSALLDRLEVVYLEAFDLLGGDDEQGDLEAALRSFREPLREVTINELVDALAYQLSLVGLDVGSDDPGIDRTLLAADMFLGEVKGIDDRLAELQVGRERVAQEIVEIERAIAEAEPETENEAETEHGSADESGGGLGADEAELGGGADADVGSDGAVDTAAETERRNEELALLAAELELANVEAADYAELLEGHVALVEAATSVEATATERLLAIAAGLIATAGGGIGAAGELPRPGSDPAFEVDPSDADAGAEAIEFYLLSRLAAQRSVSFAGSVPMVIDNALSDLDSSDTVALLNKLDRMAGAVQVIYLSDDPAVMDWANAAGIHRAAFVSGQPEAN
ncbi:MAG: hypothetical protein WCK41_05895 [Actinomycetes bacterium]